MQDRELSKEDRAAAEELAGLLGVSSAELIEEFANLTPEEEAELEELLAQANEALPAMNASLDRMNAHVAHMSESIREMSDILSGTDQRLAKIEHSIMSGALDLCVRPHQAPYQT